MAASRGIPRHRVLHAPGTVGFDDVLDNFFPQGSSQWDSLGHVGYAPNMFYNGATEDDVASGRRNTIDHWARQGIAGRAVLLDMVATLADDGRPYDPGTTTAFGVDDLELARKRSGVEFQPGDVLLIHTGFAAWFVDQPAAERWKQTGPGDARVAHGEDMCRYCGTATWPPWRPTPSPSRRFRRSRAAHRIHTPDPDRPVRHGPRRAVVDRGPGGRLRR